MLSYTRYSVGEGELLLIYVSFEYMVLGNGEGSGGCGSKGAIDGFVKRGPIRGGPNFI